MVETVSQLEADLPEIAAELIDETNLAQRTHGLTLAPHKTALLELFKTEVDRLVSVDGAKALRAGECALELSGLIATPQARALGNWAYALGMTVQGEFQDALKSYIEARSLYLQEGDDINAHRVAIRQLQALALTGQFEEALSLAYTTRNGFRDLKLEHDEARIANNIGIILKRLGRFDEAVTTLTEAKLAFESLDATSDLALVELNLGDAYANLDRFNEALIHVESAETLFETLGQTNHYAGALIEKALLYRREGRLGLVLDTLARARGLLEQLDNSGEAAFAQLEEARIHLELNLLEEAEVLTRGVIDVFVAKEMPLEELEAMTVLGMTLAKLRQFSKAKSVLKKTHAGWLALGNETQAAWSSVYLATFSVEQENLSRARAKKISARLSEALAAFDANEVRAGQAMSRLLLAKLEMTQNHLEEAATQLREAEPFIGSLAIPDLVMRSSRLAGQLALRRGDLAEAELKFREAIAELEGVRASLNVDEFKTSYFGEKLDVYTDLIKLLVEQGKFAQAFYFVERSKSRALLDLIGKGVSLPKDTSNPHVAELQEQLSEARASLNWHYLNAEQEGHQSPAWAKVKGAEARVTTLIRDIERLTPQGGGLEQVNVPTPEEVQEKLEASTIILEYFVLEGSLVAFIITGQSVRFVADLGDLDEILQTLERLTFTMSRVAQGHVYEQVYGANILELQTNNALKTLFNLLLVPLKLELDGQNLIIVPHDILHNVPFAALYDGETYLSDNALVSLAPSSAVYLHCKTQQTSASEGVTAFGVPFEDIPFVRDEVEAVKGIFPGTKALVGPQATLKAFTGAAPDANVLHIATHGLYRPDNPLFSGLRFHDGWLAARDLYSLELDASLVVLSACETGLSARQSSDELFGLARGFFFAGAPCLIVSLWAVKDTPTSILMVRFYDGLKGGLSVVQALQRAQKEVRLEYPNPYHWAAFNVIGDPQRQVVSG